MLICNGFGQKIITFQSPIQNGDIRFGLNMPITDGSSPYPEQVEPTLTVLSDGRLLFGWKEADTHNGPGLRVGFCYSIDDGHTFSPNTLMETLGPGEFQSDPWLVSDASDNAYFTFLEYGGPYEGMGVAKTTDGGESWSSPIQASDTAGYLDDKETVCVDSAGNIYMMWDHFTDTDTANLVSTKSTNGGISFQPTQSLGPWEERGGIPYITCTPNGTIYASTWDAEEPGPDMIYITKSIDYGLTWSTPRQINSWGFEDIALITVCATDGDHNVYICFAAGTSLDRDVFVAKSDNGGVSWSEPVQVNDVSVGMQRMVEMHIDDSDTIHAAWLDARNGEWDIYYSYSNDGGISFSPNIRITSEGFPLSFTRPGDYFTLRSGPTGKLYIVWTDGRKETDQDIYFAKQDLEAPQITHPLISLVSQFTPVTFIVNVTDDDSVALVELHYQINQNSWRAMLMPMISDDIYQLTIPGSLITGNILNYYFIANDSAGRSTRLPAVSPESFSIMISPLSPTLLITVIIAITLIVIVIAFSFWYLRRPKTK